MNCDCFTGFISIREQKLDMKQLALILFYVAYVSGHARLVNPPSRASMWRFGFPTPQDYNDNQGFCGGFDHQFNDLGGLCGICGDAYDAEVREHEAPGGKFATGTIVQTYKMGQVMTVSVEVTANHWGFFTFKMCPNNNIKQDPKQDCFDRFPLKLYPSGEDRFYLPDHDLRMFNLQLQLPGDVACDQCILQWKYTAGNSWGVDPDGTGCLGCGNQETFMACSDIAIQSNEPTTATSEQPTSFLPTTSTSSSTFGTSSASNEVLTCVALPPYENDPSMDEWCTSNCKLDFCPDDLCACS